jgi:threonine dehydrogenase-like Zn-dependent dehydrogenase
LTLQRSDKAVDFKNEIVRRNFAELSSRRKPELGSAMVRRSAGSARGSMTGTFSVVAALLAMTFGCRAPPACRRLNAHILRTTIMRALTVAPGIANSARIDDVPEPPRSDGAILVRTLALGVCGTDREIVAGDYGWAPPGETRLVIGHESFGEVQDAPAASGFAAGDRVVGIVRRPDPVPCSACAAGEWDMCRNGRYTERGIKERNGYGADYFRIEPDFLVKVDAGLGDAGVLVEPTSVVAKAWDHTERIGQRARSWKPQTLLVTGAGPIGLLAAMIGAQRGLDVHVLDHRESLAKRRIVQTLGATFHLEALADLDVAPDIVMECTGAPSVVRDLLGRTASGGIVCLVGVSSRGHAFSIDVGGFNRTMVLDNDTVFGSVNANRRHYQDAVAALQRADKAWLASLITRRVPVEQWTQALDAQPDDIKVVVDFS